MIDIHCHILPETDDGAKTLEDALDMARVAVSEGITTIVATPHHRNGKYDTPKPVIIEKVEQLNKQLTAAQIPLTIVPGQEARIFGEMVESYNTDELLSLNDHKQYILVELPNSHVPNYTKQLLFDLQQKGVVPIIVHPERNPELMQNPDLLYQYVKSGALTQVTAASVVGKFGKKIQKFSLDLIEYNLTHFVASDAHNVSTRGFHLRSAYELIEAEFGTYTRYYFSENAELLVEGKYVAVNPPEAIKRKRFLGIF